MNREDFEYFYQLKKDNEILESKLVYYCDMLDIYAECFSNIVSIARNDDIVYHTINRYIKEAKKKAEELKKPLDF